MNRFIFAGFFLAPAFAVADDGGAPALSIDGFARLDALANFGRLSSIDQPLFVEQLAIVPEHQLTMTPRLSRVGLSIDRWDLAHHLSAEGRLEIDFAGAPGIGAVRLRHAYGTLTWEHRLELLVGQTWDLISPLFPSAQNDTQLLYAGNTGDRRPQVRLTAYPNDKLRVAIAVGAAGIVERAYLGDTGLTAQLPMLQWLVEVRARFAGDVARLGLWGHAAREEQLDGTRHASSSVGMHFYMPLVRRVALLGEAYFGHALADIGGGIGQSVNATTGNPINGAGGWIEQAVAAGDRHVLALGGSVDLVNPDDVQPGDRIANGTVYAALRYHPKSALQLGVEYVYWRTTYKDLGAATANRLDVHFSLMF
jgi:hypothetical protein